MKTITTIFLTLISFNITAQNLQLHYDFGEDRKFLTATLEMFKPDTFGSTFWFVDFDFDFAGKPRSMSSAYWEIAREFYIPGVRKVKGLEQLAFHIEYNDGFLAYKIPDHEIAAASYNSVLLAGLGYPVKIGPVIVSTMLLCRMPRGMDTPDFQFTSVWFQPVWKNRILLTGFMDIWSQDKLLDPDSKEIVFQTEPQVWYLITPKIAAGGEIEISKNFPVGPNEWEFSPTIGCRWEF
jgi:hypothetical protein